MTVVRLVVGAVLAVAVLGAWAVPSEASPVRMAVSIPLPNPVNPLPDIGSAVSGLAGAAAKDSAATVLDAVSTWVAAGTTTLLGSLASAVDGATQPDITKTWFGDHYGRMINVALLLALPLLFAAAITSIVRQDAGMLLRAVFVHLPIATIGTGAAVTLVNLALAATDWLCAVGSGNPGTDVEAMFKGLATTVERGGIGATGFALVLVCVLVSVGAFFLTLEMIVRSAAIYVAVLFLPVALVGLVWPATARWGKRLAEMLAVLILSKFVVVAIITMAVSAVKAGAMGDGLSSLLAGAALLMLAGAAPFTLLRMVPIVEAGMIAHLDGVAPHSVPDAPVSPQQVISRLVNGSGAHPPDGPPPSSAPQIDRAAATRGVAADGTQMLEGTGGAAGGGAAGGGVAGTSAAAAGATVAGPVVVVAAAGRAAAHAANERLQGGAATQLAGGDRGD